MGAAKISITFKFPPFIKNLSVLHADTAIFCCLIFNRLSNLPFQLSQVMEKEFSNQKIDYGE